MRKKNLKELAFERLLGHFATEQLQATLAAMQDGRLIRRAYRKRSGGRDFGCLLYWVSGGTIFSTATLRKYFRGDDAGLVTATSVIDAWDRGELSDQGATAVLNRVIAQRARMNALEEKAIKRMIDALREREVASVGH